jgi:hypothetical protein
VIRPIDSVAQLLQSLESEAHPLKRGKKLCFYPSINKKVSKINVFLGKFTAGPTL